MNDIIPAPNMATAARLSHDLRDLNDVDAPTGLTGTVMATLGIGDAYTTVTTPLGPALLAYTTYGVSALRLDSSASAFERAHRHRTGRTAHPVAALPPSLDRAVAGRLTGHQSKQGLQFDLRGLSDFEAAVLRAALTIPRGEVRPYSWVARAIGNPGAVRAVGSALGRNPIPLLIPCHRVVQSDGSIGHYALGPAAKRQVLAGEGIDPGELDDLAAAGVRYFGSDTTHIFCFPTCRHARRTTDRHRVTFPTADAAWAAGYRPCRVCAPAPAARAG